MISKATLRARVLLIRLSRTELKPRKGVVRLIPREAPKTLEEHMELKLEDEAAVSTCAGDREANLNCPLFRLDITPLID